MAKTKITRSTHWDTAPIYVDPETGISMSMSPFTILRAGSDGPWSLHGPTEDEQRPLNTDDFFVAYRVMVDAFEAWFRAQPRRSVYFIGEAAKLYLPVKIGIAIDLQSRLSNLQVGSPNKLQILASIYGDGNLEREYHLRFWRQQRSGEWFTINQKILTEIERLNGLAR